jgi:ATP-dependent protease ClpP protease subunit
MPSRFILLSVASILFASVSASVFAAKITVRQLRHSTLIHLQGEIEPGDDDRIIQLLREHPRSYVSFDSVGGDLMVGLNIGQALSLHRAGTIVESEAKCTSACALAWLGGAKRLMGRASRIGFHAAPRQQSGASPVEKSDVGALADAYLRRLGLTHDAIAFMKRAAPNSMVWLTPYDARWLRIDIIEIEGLLARCAGARVSNATAGRNTSNEAYRIRSNSRRGYRVRSGPGKNQDAFFALPAGTPAIHLIGCNRTIAGRSYGWCEIEWQGLSGWVHAAALEEEQKK